MNITMKNDNSMTKKYYFFFLLLTMFVVSVSHPAFAAGGVDTGLSTVSAIRDWINDWVPIVAVIAIIALGISWMMGLIQAGTAIKTSFGVIIIGSAAYLVSLAGLSVS